MTVDVVTVLNSSFGNNRLRFHGNGAMPDDLERRINMAGGVSRHPGKIDLLVNGVPGKRIVLKTSTTVELSSEFSAAVVQGPGVIVADSDLTGITRWREAEPAGCPPAARRSWSRSVRSPLNESVAPACPLGVPADRGQQLVGRAALRNVVHGTGVPHGLSAFRVVEHR
jgi:hypothetical protein